MQKRYFSPQQQQKRELSLTSVLIGVILAGCVLYGAGRLYAYIQSAPGAEAAPQAGATAPSVDEARAALGEGDAEKAKALLAGKGGGAQAKVLLAEAEEKSGNAARARALFEEAVGESAQTPDYPAAAVALARHLQRAGERDRALTLLNEVRDRSPGPWRAAALNGLAADAETHGDKPGALAAYEQAFKDAEIDSEAWNEALDNLGRLNVELIFSRAETPEAKYHVVQPGENITSIGMKLNTTQGLLMVANGIEDPAAMRAGHRLKYTPKDFRILIERSTCRMFLLDSEGVFKRYYTGLGMPGYETTLGSYTIGNKQKDPTWFKPGSEPIPPNDPRNELGTRWMPLVPREEGLPTDLGIHGTIDPASIGKYQSHGCPRLQKEDVEELYDLVVRSTPVTIVEKIDWDVLDAAETVLS